MPDGTGVKDLKSYADELRNHLKKGVVALSVNLAADKCLLLVAVTNDLKGKVSAGSLIKEIAPIIGGNGGGSPLMAQAGGNKPKEIEKAFKRLEEIVGAI